MDTLTALDPGLLAAAVAIAAAGGFMRGFSGFGSNLVMAPLYTLVFDPVPAVLLAILLDLFATVPLVPGGLRLMRRAEILPLSVAAAIVVPVGGWMLVVVDPTFMRLAIAIIVIAFALAMLSGKKYSGPRGVGPSAVVGVLSGLLTGATSMGGPPVVLYMLTTDSEAKQTRAGLHIYSIIVETVAIFGFFIVGILSGAIFAAAAALLPVMLAGTWLGTKVFWRISDRVFRLAALWFLVAIGVMVFSLSI